MPIPQSLTGGTPIALPDPTTPIVYRPEGELMTLDLAHLRPGMIAVVTLDDGTTCDPAVVRNEPGVGLYAGPILARLPNGLAAPGVAAVAVEDDVDTEVEALARAIFAAFCRHEWAAASPEIRRDYRVGAENLIAEGWRRNQPETIEVVKDCFDDVSDDNLEQIAERPEAAPVSLVMSVASRRARKALDLRHDARETTGEEQDHDGDDVKVTVVTCPADVFRSSSRVAARVDEAYYRAYAAGRGDA